MTQTVTGEDGTVHNFPDEATPEMMAQALGGAHENDAPRETSGFISRVGTGAMDPAYGISQLVPRGISAVTSLGGSFPNKVSDFYAKDAAKMDQAVKEREADYEAHKPQGFDWGRLTGNILSPVNLMGAGEAAAAPSLGGKMLSGAAAGVTAGATMPVTDTDNYASEKAKQAGFGAVGGAVAPMLGEGISRVLSPKTDQAAKSLIDEGIRLTPGQILGSGWKKTEDKLTSIPFVGDMIRGAQNRSIEDLNRAAVNRSLKPIGDALPKGMLGREAVEYAQNALGKKYDDLLPKLTGKIDQQFSDDLGALADNVSQDFIMNAPEKEKFGNILDSLIKNRVSDTGHIHGEAIKDIESQLTDIIPKFKKSLNPSENSLGDALSEAQSSLRNMVARSNPAHADELNAINTGYANFKRIQKAAASLGNEEGVFTPSQLQSAVKTLDRSKDKGKFAKGEALMQDLSDKARKVLPSKIADSGTAGRGMMGLGLFGLGQQFVSPATIPAGAAAAALYTPLGQKMAQAILTERPDIIRSLGPKAAKYAQYLGAPVAAELAK